MLHGALQPEYTAMEYARLPVTRGLFALHANKLDTCKTRDTALISGGYRIRIIDSAGIVQPP